MANSPEAEALRLSTDEQGHSFGDFSGTDVYLVRCEPNRPRVAAKHAEETGLRRAVIRWNTTQEKTDLTLVRSFARV